MGEYVGHTRITDCTWTSAIIHYQCQICSVRVSIHGHLQLLVCDKLLSLKQKNFSVGTSKQWPSFLTLSSRTHSFLSFLVFSWLRSSPDLGSCPTTWNIALRSNMLPLTELRLFNNSDLPVAHSWLLSHSSSGLFKLASSKSKNQNTKPSEFRLVHARFRANSCCYRFFCHKTFY